MSEQSVDEESNQSKSQATDIQDRGHKSLGDSIPSAQDLSLTFDKDEHSSASKAELEIELPNIEDPKEPFVDPFTVIMPTGFSVSPLTWADKLSIGTEVDELFDVLTNFIEGNAGTSFYSQALEGQHLGDLPYPCVIDFSNMTEISREFSLSLPSHYPVVHIARRDNNLQLESVPVNLNTVIVDLVNNKLELVWKGYVDTPGQNALDMTYNAKYLFVQFENIGIKKSLDEIQKDFKEQIEPWEAAERIANEYPEEALVAKFNDLKNVLVENLKTTGVPEDEVALVAASNTPEELEKIATKMVEESVEDLNKIIDNLNARTQALKDKFQNAP